MEEEFYKYADVEDLASELNISKELATTFHRFWTLKRKVQFNMTALSVVAQAHIFIIFISLGVRNGKFCPRCKRVVYI